MVLRAKDKVIDDITHKDIEDKTGMATEDKPLLEINISISEGYKRNVDIMIDLDNSDIAKYLAYFLLAAEEGKIGEDVVSIISTDLGDHPNFIPTLEIVDALLAESENEAALTPLISPLDVIKG